MFFLYNFLLSNAISSPVSCPVWHAGHRFKFTFHQRHRDVSIYETISLDGYNKQQTRVNKNFSIKHMLNKTSMPTIL